MRVIPIRTRQVPSKSRRQAHAIVFELRANRKLTSETACLQRIRPSGGIHSAHAGVSNKPRATNAAQHGWIQNATKWLDRDEVRSREPRHPADVKESRNVARSRLGLERTNVRDGPPAAASRKIHRRHVIERNVTKKFVRTQRQTPILGCGRTHRECLPPVLHTRVTSLNKPW